MSPIYKVPIYQQAPVQIAKASASPDELRLWQALEEVDDPEYPISVVDMGLIYGLQRQERQASVKLTFTSMGCPCMEFIISDIRERLLQEEDIDDVDIEIVWDPPWTRQQLTPKAIEQLKSWGINGGVA